MKFRKKIEIFLNPEGIWIVDDGRGVSAEELEKIKEPQDNFVVKDYLNPKYPQPVDDFERKSYP